MNEGVREIEREMNLNYLRLFIIISFNRNIVTSSACTLPASHLAAELAFQLKFFTKNST